MDRATSAATDHSVLQGWRGPYFQMGTPVHQREETSVEEAMKRRSEGNAIRWRIAPLVHDRADVRRINKAGRQPKLIICGETG